VVTLKEDSDSETPASSCSGVQPIVSEQNEQLIPLTFSAVESGVEVNYITLTSPYHPDRLWGPPNLLSSGYSPGVKQQGSEADHSALTSA
jgi:hypothetical protein